MLRARYQSGKRPGRAALTAAAVAGLAAFALVWLVLKPTTEPPLPLVATARTRGLFDTQLAQPELVLAALLSPESLNSAIREAGLSTGDGPLASTGSGFAEKVRESLRIDLGSTDEAGVQTIAIRWRGESSPWAARLVNALARRLEQKLFAGDTASLEAAYTSARQAVRETSQTLSEMHERLESAVASAGVIPQAPMTELAPAVEDVDAPRLAPRREPSRDTSLLAQQVDDLESRRQTLSERLMPEHPEMKSLDEKIAALRRRLAEQPLPEPVADSPQFMEPGTRRGSPPLDTAHDPAATLQLARLADDLPAARARYETATATERAAWQALCTARKGSVIEIEPATAMLPPPSYRWQRWLITSLCGLLSSALVLLLWPVRRVTFSTVEEVRAVTRLPVVSVSRHSLN